MTTSPAFAEALICKAPAASMANAMMLFGQFVGSWDVEVNWYQAGHVVRRAHGEWHFSWILEGRGIQDVWIVPVRGEQSKGDTAYEYGTTIRFYDPTIKAWRSTWHGPMHGLVIPFVARQIGDEIVLEGRHVGGQQMRWIFSEIRQDRFLWRSVILPDDGADWTVIQDFAVRRRS
jgi:hypothetical protein